ncbi:MAG: hypothetical protein ACRENA_01465 [Vulcanimicrobiaceae bacterium]
MDLDLDAYAEDAETTESGKTQPLISPPPDPERPSVLDAAERAGVPLEELMPKLDR